MIYILENGVEVEIIITSRKRYITSLYYLILLWHETLSREHARPSIDNGYPSIGVDIS